MNHLKFDLGNLSAGTAIRVDLEGTEANVRLLDSSNYRLYAAGGGHRYADGGHYKSSPAVLRVPSSGHWYVAVDYGGYAGQGRASVHVLTNA